MAGAIDLSQWARTHQQAFTFLGIVLVLLLAGGVYYVRFQRSMTIEAVNRLEIIHETIAFSAFEDAKTQLSTFLDQFGGTDQAREAVILLGRLHLEGGDAAVAINVLERADLGLRDPIGVQAHSLLARAYVDQGRWAEAEASFLEVADRAAFDFQIRRALDSAARVRRRQQNHIGAVELYERILATFEDDDPAKGVYELRLAEVLEFLS